MLNGNTALVYILTRKKMNRNKMPVLFNFFQITQLKIDNNPFAKGFRDTGNGRREKRWVWVFASRSL